MYIYIYTRFAYAPYGAGEVVQSTVRSSVATLKEILKAQPSKAQPSCVLEGSGEQSSVELCFRRRSRAQSDISKGTAISGFAVSGSDLNGKPII